MHQTCSLLEGVLYALYRCLVSCFLAILCEPIIVLLHAAGRKGGPSVGIFSLELGLTALWEELDDLRPMLGFEMGRSQPSCPNMVRRFLYVMNRHPQEFYL